MHPMLNTAVKAARKAGSIITRASSDIDRLTIRSKRKNDFVSEVDHAAEEAIIGVLREAYPAHGILAEESGSTDLDAEFVWVIDPLDGTTNYLYGHPQWSVSVGIEIDGVGSVGVVDAPILRETYTAAVGRGAFCNRLPIRASGCDSLGHALVATGFGYETSLRQWQGAIVATLLPEIRDLRRGGSAALDLCFVACGRVDAYFERGCNAWDLSAGSVLVREAGGTATGLAGPEPVRDLVVAAGATLHPMLRSRLTQLID